MSDADLEDLATEARLLKKFKAGKVYNQGLMDSTEEGIQQVEKVVL